MQAATVRSWELGRNNFKTAIGTYAGSLLILILGTNALPSSLNCVSITDGVIWSCLEAGLPYTGEERPA